MRDLLKEIAFPSEILQGVIGLEGERDSEP